MIGEYRFLRTREGSTTFAFVRLSSQPSSAWRVTWSSQLSQARERYGAAVEAGIQLARAAHAEAGGQPQSVEISELVGTDVDTRTDAVASATVIAAWKSWGHPETDAEVTDVDGSWTVRLRAFGS